MFNFRKISLAIAIILIAISLSGEASIVRRNLLDNLNSGLKLLGKNDRRLQFNRNYYYKRFQQSGVSNKIADLVSQTFAPTRSDENVNKNRQDHVTIGEDGTASLSDSSFMTGLLKLLGLDGSKIGAAAVNGIVFIAQMVRYSATKFMDLMMSKTWDWYLIVDYISNRIKNETSATPTMPVESKRSIWNVPKRIHK